MHLLRLTPILHMKQHLFLHRTWQPTRIALLYLRIRYGSASNTKIIKTIVIFSSLIKPVVMQTSLSWLFQENRRCKLFGEYVHFFTSQCVQFHCSILQLPFNRLYYTFIRQKKQHMTFSVILSVHCKYWLRLLRAYMFFLYFWRYYSFIETYSIRYDKTLLYIFMFRCDNILILSALPAFEPNRIALRFHLKYS